MFDPEDDFTQEKFTINKAFAAKFDKKKEREFLDQSKQKYGKDLEKMLNEEEDSQSSESEDENAVLLNENISSNFLTTLARIRTKDPSIYKTKKEYFKEEDFDIEDDDDDDDDEEEDTNTEKGKGSKPLYYKDLVRQEALEGDGDEVSPKKRRKGETPFEEEQRLKNEFKLAVKQAEDDNNEEETGGLFKVKKKTKQQIEDEEEAFNKYLKKEEKKGNKKEAKMLSSFWGDESKLDDTDKFLRKYILTKGWIDNDDMDNEDDPVADPVIKAVDDEDERRDDEMEEFEEKINFRFEESGANQIITHGRKVDDSARQTDSKRADKRKEKLARREDDLKQQTEEVKRIKSSIRSEIVDRLKKIESAAGSKAKDDTMYSELLKTEEFDPDDYDKKMQEMYGDDFYDDEDEDEDELKEYEKQLAREELGQRRGEDEDRNNNNGKTDKDSAHKNGSTKNNADVEQDKENILQPKSSIPIANKQNLKANEVEAMNQDIGQIWWYCDDCLRGIKEGEKRFDCLECEDYTLCKRCADLQEHPHKMKPFVIPKGCKPPLDSEIKRIVEKLKYCADCSYKFTEYDEIYKLKTNADFMLCTSCFKAQEKKYKPANFDKVLPEKINYEELVKQDVNKIKELGIKDDKLAELIDLYYRVDFEDIIAGGIKTRFKYVDVKANSYGLADEDLLYTDEKDLKKFVSLKKLAPYREDDGTIDMKKARLMKQNVRKSAENNMAVIRKEITKVQEIDDKLNNNKKKLKAQDITKLEKAKEKALKNAERVRTRKEPVHIEIERDVPEDDENVDMEVESEEEVEVVKQKKKREKKTKPLSQSRMKAYGLVKEE